MLPTPGAPIELAEYCERPLTLTSVQAHHLTSVAKHRLGVAPEVGVDQWRIRATSYVGTIVIPGLKLLVTPKVSTANLFHLLEAGGKALEVGVEQFEYDRHHDLLAAISTFYARHLERAIGLGLSRSYVEHEDRLATIRGRIDLPAQRRAVGLPLPVSCRFDEHTPDIPLNRIVRAAAMRLLSVADVTRSTREALVSLIGRFVEVGDVRSTDLRQPTIFTRLNEHWRPAERLARLVLEGSSLQGATGATSAGVFLVDMNQLFEKFVEVRLQRELRPALTVSGQQPGHLDVCHEAGIRPDLTFVERSGAIVYVGDTKYKVTTDGYARDSD
ncbi:MAG: McrC family protein [Ilumatobacteraceae bacterium]